MRNEIQVVDHKGKKIILLDFSNSTKESIQAIIAESKDFIKKQPASSALTLTDISNLHFDSDVMNMFKEFTVHNKPFVKAGAVVGVKGILKAAYNFVMYFSGRNLPLFETREKAMDWLVSQ